MVTANTFSHIDNKVIEQLITELESETLSSESKLLLNEILKAFSKVIDGAKASSMTMAKLKSMLGFYSEKSKK